MMPGQMGHLDTEHYDHFVPVTLAAAETPRGLIACNERLGDFLASEVVVDRLPIYSFFPPALAGAQRNVRIVKAIKSGGRTFMLAPESAEALGIPPVLLLDLKKLGWGSGYLELRPEVKGAGCFLEHCGLDISKLHNILRCHVFLHRSFQCWSSFQNGDAVLSSLAEIEGRNAGGQEPSFGRHAVRSSMAMLGETEVKFAPSLYCVRHTGSFAQRLRVISAAISRDGALYSKSTSSELRYTAGSIRAVYFDSANSDLRLQELCERVSHDVDELYQALDSMLEDPRRYLELVAISTYIEPGGGYRWTKVGDISLTFRRDPTGRATLAREYRNVHRRAWYLAKDEIIVRKVGKLFVDMESFRSWPSAYKASSTEDLWFQHELFVINVLRDHIRVCVQFTIAIDLKLKGQCDYRRRLEIQKMVLQRIIASVNRSPWVSLVIGRSTAEVEIHYAKLRSSKRYRFIRAQIGERYV
jgi:hypothetical protein